MTGDGIMALSGSPIALEDACQRAIRSALAIHKETAQFSATPRLDKETKISLRTCIGIHTGTLIVAAFGNNLRVEFKAVGDAVNLASRMEKLAEAGTIYVSEDTFKLTVGYIRRRPIGDGPNAGSLARASNFNCQAQRKRNHHT